MPVHLFIDVAIYLWMRPYIYRCRRVVFCGFSLICVDVRRFGVTLGRLSGRLLALVGPKGAYKQHTYTFTNVLKAQGGGNEQGGSRLAPGDQWCLGWPSLHSNYVTTNEVMKI